MAGSLVPLVQIGQLQQLAVEHFVRDGAQSGFRLESTGLNYDFERVAIAGFGDEAETGARKGDCLGDGFAPDDDAADLFADFDDLIAALSDMRKSNVHFAWSFLGYEKTNRFINDSLEPKQEHGKMATVVIGSPNRVPIPDSNIGAKRLDPPTGLAVCVFGIHLEDSSTGPGHYIYGVE
ncbi:hypothetical protein D3C71_1092170 [compost metagenome]